MIVPILRIMLLSLLALLSIPSARLAHPSKLPEGESLQIDCSPPTQPAPGVDLLINMTYHGQSDPVDVRFIFRVNFDPEQSITADKAEALLAIASASKGQGSRVAYVSSGESAFLFFACR